MIINNRDEMDNMVELIQSLNTAAARCYCAMKYHKDYDELDPKNKFEIFTFTLDYCEKILVDMIQDCAEEDKEQEPEKSEFLTEEEVDKFIDIYSKVALVLAFEFEEEMNKITTSLLDNFVGEQRIRRSDAEGVYELIERSTILKK